VASIRGILGIIGVTMRKGNPQTGNEGV